MPQQLIIVNMGDLLLQHFRRPFAVLLAEIVHHYFPKYVELHNYSSANSIRQKLYNWSTLNRASLLVDQADPITCLRRQALSTSRAPL